MYNPIAVANHFINEALKAKVRDVNARKIQDLVYCAHGWTLAIHGRPLIDGEVMAVDTGPEIPDLAEAAAGYGTRGINEHLSQFRLDNDTNASMKLDSAMLPPDVPERRVLLMSWKAYGTLSPFDLSQITRISGGPWDKVWNSPKRDNQPSVKIDQLYIYRWFADLAERNRRRVRAKSVEDTQRIDPDCTDTKRLRPV